MKSAQRFFCGIRVAISPETTRLQTGFTLLEVMVALAIATFSMLACFVALESGLKALADSRDSDRAVSLLQYLIAEARTDTAHELAAAGSQEGPGGALNWRRTISRDAVTGAKIVSVSVSRAADPSTELVAAKCYCLTGDR